MDVYHLLQFQIDEEVSENGGKPFPKQQPVFHVIAKTKIKFA